MKTLFTGHPRSGTGYMSKLMRRCGLDVPHESAVGKDGIASWLHVAPGGKVYWLPNGVPAANYDKIIHLVRNPLDVIASAETLSFDAWDYMFAKVGYPSEPRRPSVKWAMFSWLKWNELIESKCPDLSIRVEDVESMWPLICETVGIDAEFPKVSKKTNSRRHGKMTWAHLESLDPDLCALVKAKAQKYGYQTEDPKIEPAKISVCMIVRDEQKNLMRCLRSVKPIADEIVVVDTGSVDRTVELAIAQGCKVYLSPWRDDFSFHRNESFGYASNDWILRIDADEELVLKCSPDEFKRQLASLPPECSATRNLMQDMQGGQVAMEFMQFHFFRRGRVTWKNRKHNSPQFTGPVYHLEDVETRHYGYDIPDGERRRKNDRDRALLEKMREEDDSPKTLFFLSQLYGHYDRDAAKARDCIEAYIEKARDSDHFNPSAYMTAFSTCLKLDDQASAKKWLLEALEKYPGDLDCNFCACRLGILEKDEALLVRGMNGYLEAWDLYAANPASRDGRFTYYRNPDALAYVLRVAAVHHLYNGIQYLEQFRAKLPDCSEDQKKHLEADMETDLEAIGVNWFDRAEAAA